MQDRIPLTLITGYLGAGKTTLLNALLRDASAGRIAVIVNEFGDVGLDHDLIVTATEDLVLLPSGCLCCTVRGDLVQALERLVARRAAGVLAFDRIVIETTGLADPGPILHTLIVTPSLGAALRMDGMVTVCDAANGAATLDHGFESVTQVAMADVIVITKSDLVPPAQLATFQARLAAIAPGATQIVAVNAQVPVAALFGKGTPEQDGHLPGAVGWINAPAYAPAYAPSCAPDYPAALPPRRSLADIQPQGLLAAKAAPGLFATLARPAARHDDRITAVSAIYDAPLQPHILELWLEALIALRGPDILRLKAVLWVDGYDTPFVIHGVQHIIDPPVRLQRWLGADHKSRIVIIGRDLPRATLLDALDMLRIRPDLHILA